MKPKPREFPVSGSLMICSKKSVAYQIIYKNVCSPGFSLSWSNAFRGTIIIKPCPLRIHWAANLFDLTTNNIAYKCGSGEVFKGQKTINRWVFLVVVGLILKFLNKTKW